MVWYWSSHHINLPCFKPLHNVWKLYCTFKQCRMVHGNYPELRGAIHMAMLLPKRGIKLRCVLNLWLGLTRLKTQRSTKSAKHILNSAATTAPRYKVVTWIEFQQGAVRRRLDQFLVSTRGDQKRLWTVIIGILSTKFVVLNLRWWFVSWSNQWYDFWGVRKSN
jgi:hypothetical protein